MVIGDKQPGSVNTNWNWVWKVLEVTLRSGNVLGKRGN